MSKEFLESPHLSLFPPLVSGRQLFPEPSSVLVISGVAHLQSSPLVKVIKDQRRRLLDAVKRRQSVCPGLRNLRLRQIPTPRQHPDVKAQGQSQICESHENCSREFAQENGHQSSLMSIDNETSILSFLSSPFLFHPSLLTAKYQLPPHYLFSFPNFSTCHFSYKYQCYLSIRWY